MTSVEELTGMSADEYEAELPRPTGYRLLVLLPKVEETYEGSEIVKSHDERRAERILSTMGAVLDMGPDAYQDKKRFPNGPWCKVGDYVMFRGNTGTRFMFAGSEYRLMNDESIEAVVPAPNKVTRAT